nr:MAG TPA: hypothetical protein [Caudoviricetes sp.]
MGLWVHVEGTKKSTGKGLCRENYTKEIIS